MLTQQAVVTHFRQGTQADFEAAFTHEDGKLWSFTHIVSHLRDVQVKENNEIANYVKQTYGPQLGELVWYRKGSAVLEMSKNSAIAKKVRDMGLHLPQSDLMI